jgi:fumarate reductase subunit D
MKRSNAPIFWSMFGAGGMISALIAPALVLITGILVPLGIMPANTLAYGHVLAFAHNPLGKLLLFVVVALFMWHAVHRIFHSLHDLGIHASAATKLACYGPALAVTVIAAWALLSV